MPQVSSGSPTGCEVAFARKLTDMMGLEELDALRPEGIPSRTVIDDNADVNTYRVCAEPANLAVAHPPCLNSLDCLPVFSLELATSSGWPRNPWATIKMQLHLAVAHLLRRPHLIHRFGDTVPPRTVSAHR